jgi:putative folate metabolism gamma-glutamate ligase
MIINPIRTETITVQSTTLHDLIDAHVKDLPERSILVITSKIVSLCEGNVVKIGDKDKLELVREQAQQFISPKESKYNITLTITRNTLIPTAGIDESNGNGYYVLWPKDPDGTAKEIRSYLVNKYNRKEIGVLITDSTTAPMRLGTRGTAIGYSGFHALNNYIGSPDLFGRQLKVTQSNIADGIAAAAVVSMGEGDERLPMAIVTDIPFVTFDPESPTPEERKSLTISLEDDMYAKLISHAPWQKGNAKK